MKPVIPDTGSIPVSPEVWSVILDGYSLPVLGTHGIGHWARVLEIGRRIGPVAGADLAVVELFAVFHDARRINEWTDPGHGRRGAELARKLRDSLPPLTDAQFDLLCYACRHHTDGTTHPDATIGACWDSDRLDLARVGIRPDPLRLCTGAARDREVLRWANRRSEREEVPPYVRARWLRSHGEEERLAEW